jgi:ACS family hexuronate transporter-like MFS transporter
MPAPGHHFREPPAGGKARRAAWWIAGVLFLATVLNYIDRQVLSLNAEHVMGDFDLTREQLGWIVASFRYAYAGLQLAGGWLVDFAGAWIVYPAAVGLWSLAGLMTAWAASARQLAAWRFLLGAGEAFNWPCALQVTRRLLEPRDRALANGIFNSGSAFGALIAPVLVTFLTIRYGWRASFLITGSLGLFWILLWWRTARPSRGRLRGDRGERPPLAAIFARIFRRRAFWLLSVSAVIVNSVSYLLADWIPLYLKTERRFGFAEGNALSMLIFAGLDVGNLAAGVLTRHLAMAGMPLARARRTTLLVACCLMTAAAGAGYIPSAGLAVALLILTAIGVAGFLVIYLTLVQEVDPDNVGAAAGLLGGIGNLSYGLASPYIGRLADLGRSRSVFLLAGLLPWLAFLAIRRVLGARRENESEGAS